MTTNQTQAVENLDRYIRARYPLIGVVSREETRVFDAIVKLAGYKRQIAIWSYTEGLKPQVDEDNPEPFQGLDSVDPDMTQEPSAALAEVANFDDEAEIKPTLFIFKDLHNMLEDAQVVRYLRDIAARFEVRRHNLIILAQDIKVPCDLDLTLLDWPLPYTAELASILKQAEVTLPERIPVTLNGNRDKVVQALHDATALLLTRGMRFTIYESNSFVADHP
jgi:hypothetical protein